MQQERKPWMSLLLMILISLFLHILHWVLYETIAISIAMCLLTPLLLCLCYHGFQTDCGKTFGITRKKAFFGTILIPLLLAILVSSLVFVNYPHLGLYSHGGQLTGSFPEKIGLYSGRITLSSLYLLVFSLIDIPILQWQDRLRYEKESARLTETDLAEKQVYQQPDISHPQPEKEDTP